MKTLKIKTLPVNQQYATIAQVAYEANRALSEIIGGKPFNPPWEQFPEDLKQSMIGAVQTTLNDKIVSAEVSHLRWMKSRLELGYKWGEFINWKKKTHPSLVNFHDLPLEVQLKDILFLAVVNAIGGALGFREFDYDPLTDKDVTKLETELEDLRQTTGIESEETPVQETASDFVEPEGELEPPPILEPDSTLESASITDPEPTGEPNPTDAAEYYTGPEPLENDSEGRVNTILEVQDGVHENVSEILPDLNVPVSPSDNENESDNKPKIEDDTKPEQRNNRTGKGRAKKS